MAFRFSLFKTPGHQRFDYAPLYYDAEKEELKERLKAAGHQLEEDKVEGEYRRMKLAHEFSAMRRKSAAFARRQKSKSRLRFIIILGLLSYLCYWFLTNF